MDEIRKTGLWDVVLEWAKEQRYVSPQMIKQAFSLTDEAVEKILRELIRKGVIAKEPTYQKGYKVFTPALGIEIILLDCNEEMKRCWEKEFYPYPEVHAVCSGFHEFMSSHDIECVVSPGNSFGMMDGGYDAAITSYFGEVLERKVQHLIKERFAGEQPVGTALYVEIPGTSKKLIHVPSMRLPSLLKDPQVIYHCMRSTLLSAIEHQAKSIVIPAFGGGCGRCEKRVIASMMRQAYEQICHNKKN